MKHWQDFVSRFFTPNGCLIQHIWSAKDKTDKKNAGENAEKMEDEVDYFTKEFTITAASLPRYYWTFYNSGVQNLQMKVENAKETLLANNYHFVAFQKAQLTSWFGNGSQVSYMKFF